MVLSLFAVDILTHRDFHDQNLCVCDVCGRISYNPAATSRAGCGDHVPKTDTTSGFQGRGSRSSIPPANPQVQVIVDREGLAPGAAPVVLIRSDAANTPSSSKR
jgi:hypothetical protein